MTLDPATLCARTAAGEAEIAVATNGLSLSQRRVLSLLENPAAFDELAARQRLEPVRLSRDLTRLAELRLIVLQEPSVPSPPAPASAMLAERPPIAGTMPVAATTPAFTPSPAAALAGDPEPSTNPSPTIIAASASMNAVVIGSGSRRSAVTYATGGGVALAIGLGIWFATRSTEPTAGVTSATATTVARAPQSAPMTAEPATTPVPIPPNAAPGDRVAPPDAKRDVRAALMPAPAGSPKASASGPTAKPVAVAAATPTEPAPASTASSAAPIGTAGAPPTASPAAPLPASASVPASAFASAPASAPATLSVPAATSGPAETRPTIVLAAAAPPSSPATTPPIAAALKAIQREPPVFPREAIAAGIETGSVKARLHVDANGNVTAVDILSAQPQRVFDRAVRGALQRWQFEPGAGARTTDVDVAFQRN